MQQTSPSKQNAPPFLARVNRLMGELNALLVVVAIGLAILDLTCFVTLNTVKLIHEGPQLTDIAQTAEATQAPAATRGWGW